MESGVKANPSGPRSDVLFGLSFTLSAEDVNAKTDAIVKQYEAALDSIVANTNADANANANANPFLALANAEVDAVLQSSQVTLPALTSSDAAAREASSKAKQRLREMWQNAYSRPDLYKVMQCGTINAHPVLFIITNPCQNKMHKCQMPNTNCQMPNAKPNAKMPNAKCQM